MKFSTSPQWHCAVDHRPCRQRTKSQSAGFSKLSAINSRAEQRLPSYFIYGHWSFPPHGRIFGRHVENQICGEPMSRLSSLANPLVNAGRTNPRFPAKVCSHLFTIFPAQAGRGYIVAVTSGENGQRHPGQEPQPSREILRDAKDEFITIECNTRYGETMIFPRRKCSPPQMKS